MMTTEGLHLFTREELAEKFPRIKPMITNVGSRQDHILKEQEGTAEDIKICLESREIGVDLSEGQSLSKFTDSVYQRLESEKQMLVSLKDAYIQHQDTVKAEEPAYYPNRTLKLPDYYNKAIHTSRELVESIVFDKDPEDPTLSAYKRNQRAPTYLPYLGGTDYVKEKSVGVVTQSLGDYNYWGTSRVTTYTIIQQVIEKELTSDSGCVYTENSALYWPQPLRDDFFNDVSAQAEETVDWKQSMHLTLSNSKRYIMTPHAGYIFGGIGAELSSRVTSAKDFIYPMDCSSHISDYFDVAFRASTADFYGAQRQVAIEQGALVSSGTDIISQADRSRVLRGRLIPFAPKAGCTTGLTIEASRDIIEAEPIKHGIDGIGLGVRSHTWSGGYISTEPGRTEELKTVHFALREQGLFSGDATPSIQAGDVLGYRRNVAITQEEDKWETRADNYGLGGHVFMYVDNIDADSGVVPSNNAHRI